MKLGKLLAAGKSIMNGHADVSYRSSKQIYLPKFGTSKNPFKSEPPAQTGSGMSVGSGSDASRPGPVRLADDAAASVSATFDGDSPLPVNPQTESSARAQDNRPRQAMSSGEPCQAPRIEPTSSAPGRTSAAHLAPRFTPSAQQKKGKDWNKFNPLSILRAALPAGKGSRLENVAKSPRGTATQTELSLDTVKVVHNDLSDVDVEVVPIKSRTTVSDLPAPKKSWEFVGERLFGVEAT